MRHTLAFVLIAAAAAAGPAFAQASYKGHGAASVPPEVLAQYAPKPLPPEVVVAHPDADGRARAGHGRRHRRTALGSSSAGR